MVVPRGPSLTSEKAVPGEQCRRDGVEEKVGQVGAEVAEVPVVSGSWVVKN